MLTEAQLDDFRDRYIQIVIAPHQALGRNIPAWNEAIHDPDSSHISAFLDEPAVPHDVAGPLLGLMAEIGIAHAPDVLKGVPLPVSWDGKSMRRWQLRRELDGLVGQMSDAQLQMIVFHAHGQLA